MIDGKDTHLFHGKRWFEMGVLACDLFERRLLKESHIDYSATVYGGQIMDKNGQRHSELVLENELGDYD